MGAPPPPVFTIRHPEYAMSDDVTPFRNYDYFGPRWDAPEQLEEHGVYYVGDRSDVYAVSHVAYYVQGQYMPVFRKISGDNMCTYCRGMRIVRKEARSAYIPRPVCLNLISPPPNSQEQVLKRLEVIVTVEGRVKINPNPNATAAVDVNEYFCEEDGEEVCLWSELIIEDYFCDKASSSKSAGLDDK
ncbi:hypothetical protein PTKIN_Ptkin05aG0102500 [Pterospermum kingtungense]